jgi:hypothetical protein
MSGATRHSAGRTVALPATVLVAVLLVALLAVWPSGAEGQGGRRIVVLGQTSTTPPPACPSSRCEAIGSVTGFQTAAGGGAQPFKVPFDGKIVAWSITLSRPNASQQQFFNNFYAPPPEARLAVLKRVPNENPPQFKLLRQSALINLTPYLGSRVIFTLEHPLTVRADNVVGLTIPTWAPAFAVDVDASNTWRASRKKGACKRTADIQASHAQVRVGSTRQYGCFYTTARLLYTATVVQGR